MPSDINEIFQSFLLSMVNEKNASLIKELHVRWKEYLNQPSILNNEQPKEETNPTTFSYKDIPLSGELITKEECERQKRYAFASARKLDEKYFLEMLRKNSYYPSEISTQHLQYKTFEDYQQSLK